MKLSLHGTDRNVTGSCHLPECAGRRQIPSPSIASTRGRSSWRARVCATVAGCGTLARQIIDGAEQVQIFSEDIPVRATIHTIGGFSAHADQSELLAWHRQTGRPETTFLVHGEEEAMRRFAGLLQNAHTEMPALHREYRL